MQKKKSDHKINSSQFTFLFIVLWLTFNIEYLLSWDAKFNYLITTLFFRERKKSEEMLSMEAVLIGKVNGKLEKGDTLIMMSNFLVTEVSTALICRTAPVVGLISKNSLKFSGLPLRKEYRMSELMLSMSMAWIFSGRMLRIPDRTPLDTYGQRQSR